MKEYRAYRELHGALGLVVLERLPDGSFIVHESEPGWWSSISTGDPRDPEHAAYAFLETFLPEAEEFWAARRPGRAKSGIWTEAAADGSEAHFEISAVWAGGREFLIVESLGDEYEGRQELYQKAREKTLLYEKLQRTEAALREAKAVAEAATQAVERPGRPNMMKGLIDLYLKRLPGHVTAMEQALKNRDADTLHREAHGLKGSSLTLGASHIAELCSKLQQAASDGIPEGTEALLAQLQEATQALVQS